MPCHAVPVFAQPFPRYSVNEGLTDTQFGNVVQIFCKLRRRVVSLNPDNTMLRAQVHYQPREGGRNKRGLKRPRSSPDTGASYSLQQPYSNSTACMLLRLLSSLSPPLQARVHDYVSNPPTPSNPGPRRPPLVRQGLPGEIFLMRSVTQLHTLLETYAVNYMRSTYPTHFYFIWPARPPYGCARWSRRGGIRYCQPDTCSVRLASRVPCMPR